MKVEKIHSFPGCDFSSMAISVEKNHPYAFLIFEEHSQGN
jgi:hypothetical protein